MSHNAARARAAQADEPRPHRFPTLPRIQAADWMERRPLWSMDIIDRDYEGEWAWSRLGAQAGALLDFLREMEQLSWREITEERGGRRGYHHTQPVATLTPAARARLVELQLDDVDHLFRFRLLGQKPRLWGIIPPHSPVFHLLWWDPDHRVYG